MRDRSWLICLVLLAACSKGDAEEERNSGDDDPASDEQDSQPDDPFGNSPPDAGSGPRPRNPLPDSGSCGHQCFENQTGAGTDTPFDIAQNPSDGVGLDAEGSLILQRQQARGQQLIWIANTMQGTVSKVDTETMTELARYEVEIDWSINAAENGPSRTSVDSDGNVYAGARFGSSITKVSSLGENCPDTNGDGLITTSTSAGDVLPLGEDDCVLWATNIGGDARGVAVQETPAQIIVEPRPDAPIVTEIPGERTVWVGGQERDYRLHKLDAETGEILLTIVPPAPVYGLALDGRGNLWLSGRQMDAIGRVDTTRCVDDSCGSETVCVTDCTQQSCPDTCDGSVLERIQLAGGKPYGITVDCNQRVWVGGAHNPQTDSNGEPLGGVRRYDPLAPAHQRFTFAPNVAGSEANGIHGIAADASGFVWGAAGNDGVWRIDSDSMLATKVAGTGTEEGNAKGIAIDRQGRVWAIPLRHDYAMVITPGATIDQASVDKPLSGFTGPYAYSDFSGEQRRLAANEPGSYRQLFEGCDADDKPTLWRDLTWEAETPDGAWVVFLARTADTIEALEDAEWFTVAPVPGREAPLEIEPFIRGALQTPGRYLEIDVRLFTTETGNESMNGCTVTPGVTPRVKSFGVSFECEPDLG